MSFLLVEAEGAKYLGSRANRAIRAGRLQATGCRLQATGRLTVQNVAAPCRLGTYLTYVISCFYINGATCPLYTPL